MPAMPPPISAKRCQRQKRLCWRTCRQKSCPPARPACMATVHPHLARKHLFPRNECTNGHVSSVPVLFFNSLLLFAPPKPGCLLLKRNRLARLARNGRISYIDKAYDVVLRLELEPPLDAGIVGRVPCAPHGR